MKKNKNTILTNYDANLDREIRKSREANFSTNIIAVGIVFINKENLILTFVLPTPYHKGVFYTTNFFFILNYYIS